MQKRNEDERERRRAERCRQVEKQRQKRGKQMTAKVYEAPQISHMTDRKVKTLEY